MKPLHVVTQTLLSEPMSRHTRQSVWLKLENQQPTGAYKIRGIGHMCQQLSKQGVQHFVSSSGGNAGVAVAYAGRILDIPVDVFVPESSHPLFISGIKAQGANVHVRGEVWDEAHQHALDFLDTTQGAYIPPFDHPLLWEGHASIIAEAAAVMTKPDVVIAAVGGGGLACGLLTGMHRVGWEAVPFITVETEGAASFARSVAAGELITLDKISTIATSLGAKRVAEALWHWREAHEIIPLTVTDQMAVSAISTFADDHRMLVEPSSAAVLAVLYEKRLPIEARSVLAIVCGGIGISLKSLADFLDQV